MSKNKITPIDTDRDGEKGRVCMGRENEMKQLLKRKKIGKTIIVFKVKYSNARPLLLGFPGFMKEFASFFRVSSLSFIWIWFFSFCNRH